MGSSVFIKFHYLRIANLLNHLSHVLKMNVVLLSRDGESMVQSTIESYGCQLSPRMQHIPEQFKLIDQGFYQYIDLLGLNYYAIAIDDEESAFIVVGPIMLNKKLDKIRLAQAISSTDYDEGIVLEAIDEIRVCSFLYLESVISLVRAIKDLVQAVVKDMSLVHNPYQTILDMVLELSQAQSGSIMLFNPDTQELDIKASQGLGQQFLERSRIKIEGSISGYALEHNTPLILTDKGHENRIAHLLNRGEIRQSIVLPMTFKGSGISLVVNLNRIELFNSQHEIEGLVTSIKQVLEQGVKLLPQALY